MGWSVTKSEPDNYALFTNTTEFEYRISKEELHLGADNYFKVRLAAGYGHGPGQFSEYRVAHIPG